MQSSTELLRGDSGTPQIIPKTSAPHSLATLRSSARLRPQTFTINSRFSLKVVPVYPDLQQRLVAPIFWSC
jgi:hypothetical protein